MLAIFSQIIINKETNKLVNEADFVVDSTNIPNDHDSSFLIKHEFFQESDRTYTILG